RRSPRESPVRIHAGDRRGCRLCPSGMAGRERARLFRRCSERAPRPGYYLGLSGKAMVAASTGATCRRRFDHGSCCGGHLTFIHTVADSVTRMASPIRIDPARLGILPDAQFTRLMNDLIRAEAGLL